MASQDLDRVKSLARDLRKDAPRPAGEELGGFAAGARTLDKCRATLAGWNGEFQFNCPLDQRFFRTTGINVDEFRAFVATGADDSQVHEWVRDRATAPTEST